MREKIAIAVIVVQAVIDLKFIWDIFVYRRKGDRSFDPALTTWMLFFVGSSSALMSYIFREKSWDWTNATANGIDVIGTLFISLTLIFTGHHRMEKHDVRCLQAAFGLLLIYAFAHEHLILNLSMQTLMVVAYWPTWKRLWHAPKNTENIPFWMGCLAISVTAAGLPLAQGDFVQSVYNLRAIACVLVVLTLSFRLRRMAKKEGVSA